MFVENQNTLEFNGDCRNISRLGRAQFLLVETVETKLAQIKKGRAQLFLGDKVETYSNWSRRSTHILHGLSTVKQNCFWSTKLKHTRTWSRR